MGAFVVFQQLNIFSTPKFWTFFIAGVLSFVVCSGMFIFVRPLILAAFMFSVNAEGSLAAANATAEVTVPAPFDTLEYAKRLGEGGFTPDQAQAAAKALSDALSVDMATKADIQLLDAKIETSKLQLEAKISETKWETIRWIIGIVGLQAAAIIGAVFAIIKFVK